MTNLTLGDTFQYCRKLKRDEVQPALVTAGLAGLDLPWKINQDQELAVRIAYGFDNSNEAANAYEVLAIMVRKWFINYPNISEMTKDLILNEWVLSVGSALNLGNSYRDHVLHSFSVAVVLDALRTKFPVFDMHIRETCKKVALEKLDVLSLTDNNIDDACMRAALLHDIGYFTSYAGKVIEKIFNWYSPAMSTLPSLCIISTPGCKNCAMFNKGTFEIPISSSLSNHGLPTSLHACQEASKLKFGPSEERAIWWFVCNSIRAHAERNSSVSFTDNPIGYILRLSDILQEYGRQHYQFDKEFKLIRVEPCRQLSIRYISENKLNIELYYESNKYSIEQVQKKLSSMISELKLLILPSGDPLDPRIDIIGEIKLDKIKCYKGTICDIVLP